MIEGAEAAIVPGVGQAFSTAGIDRRLSGPSPAIPSDYND
jgi:hypothetical protein